MMGGIGPTEAGKLTYWQFTAMRAVWNGRQDKDGDGEAVEPPSAEFVRQAQAELDELGITGTKH